MRIKITIPDELYAAIKAKAVANCRTLSQEICYVLSGSEWANVSHCGTIVGQGGPQGDTEGQLGDTNCHNKEEENANISQMNTEEQSGTQEENSDVDIKVGQCDPLVSQSDPEGDTVTHCGTEGDSSGPKCPNVTHIDPEEDAFLDSISIDLVHPEETPAPKIQTQAAEEYPPIDWDAVVKQVELESKAVRDPLGNKVGYLINGRIVKEEDL